MQIGYIPYQTPFKSKNTDLLSFSDMVSCEVELVYTKRNENNNILNINWIKLSR